MKVAQLWKGLYQFSMSGWYHLAAALAGLTIDTSNVNDFYIFNASSKERYTELGKEEIKL